MARAAAIDGLWQNGKDAVIVTDTKAPPTPRTAGADREKYDAVADRGCSVWPQCVSCPSAVCIAELPASEHTTFVQALKLVRRYLPPVDTAVSP